jgi:hypothetical protein
MVPPFESVPHAEKERSPIRLWSAGKTGGAEGPTALGCLSVSLPILRLFSTDRTAAVDSPIEFDDNGQADAMQQAAVGSILVDGWYASVTVKRSSLSLSQHYMLAGQWQLEGNVCTLSVTIDICSSGSGRRAAHRLLQCSKSARNRRE